MRARDFPNTVLFKERQVAKQILLLELCAFARLCRRNKQLPKISLPDGIEPKGEQKNLERNYVCPKCERLFFIEKNRDAHLTICKGKPMFA